MSHTDKRTISKVSARRTRRMVREGKRAILGFACLGGTLIPVEDEPRLRKLQRQLGLQHNREREAGSGKPLPVYEGWASAEYER